MFDGAANADAATGLKHTGEPGALCQLASGHSAFENTDGVAVGVDEAPRECDALDVADGVCVALFDGVALHDGVMLHDAVGCSGGIDA